MSPSDAEAKVQEFKVSFRSPKGPGREAVFRLGTYPSESEETFMLRAIARAIHEPFGPFESSEPGEVDQPSLLSPGRLWVAVGSIEVRRIGPWSALAPRGVIHTDRGAARIVKSLSEETEHSAAVVVWEWSGDDLQEAAEEALERTTEWTLQRTPTGWNLSLPDASLAWGIRKKRLWPAPAAAIIRPARVEDAAEIHEAHMRSIREICGPDYTTEEIEAWGGREFDSARRIRAIQKDCVWVALREERVCGYGHLSHEVGADGGAELMGLYLAPEAMGLGLGGRIMDALMREARARGIRRVWLHSTRTSVGFYERLNFRRTGPETTHEVNGQAVRCIPMETIIPVEPRPNP